VAEQRCPNFFSLTLTVYCDTAEQCLGAQEAAGRLAVGLAMEGRTIQMSLALIDSDEVDSDERDCRGEHR
jgi:hypothetical protein